MFRTLLSAMTLVFLCSLSVREPPAQSSTGWTVDQQLVVAAFQLDVDRVKSLLDGGANPNARLGFYDGLLFQDKWTLGYSPLGSDKWTPLMAVASSHAGPQPEKETENTSEAREQALQEMNRVDPKVVEERDRRRVAIAKLLIARNADLDLHDGYGATVLAMSVYLGYESLALVLIEAGADVDSRTGLYIDGTHDTTPLHYACDMPNVVRALLEHGADVQAEDSEGETPLDWALVWWQAESVRLLLEHGAGVAADGSFRDTLLCDVAGRANAERLIRLVIEHGVDVNTKDASGKTPLHRAATDGPDENVLQLINAGADVDARDSSGQTPLYAAVLYGRVENVRRLINAGADVNAKDEEGRTVLDWMGLVDQLIINEADAETIAELLRNAKANE